MKILAVDTATKTCSVAVVDNDIPLAELTLARNQTHSIHIMEMIRSVLDLSGLTVADLDGFAVTVGPGSFTGLRIGISSIKGLAAASGKPVVGVSTLDALAVGFSHTSFLICPLLDARKGEVYFARYRWVDGRLKKENREQVSPPAQAFLNILEPSLFVGDGALVYKKQIIDDVGELAAFAPPAQNIIHASSVARAGMENFIKDNTEDLSAFAPQYIRKSDAELKLRF